MGAGGGGEGMQVGMISVKIDGIIYFTLVVYNTFHSKVFLGG